MYSLLHSYWSYLCSHQVVKKIVRLTVVDSNSVGGDGIYIIYPASAFIY